MNNATIYIKRKMKLKDRRLVDKFKVMWHIFEIFQTALWMSFGVGAIFNVDNKYWKWVKFKLHWCKNNNKLIILVFLSLYFIN